MAWLLPPLPPTFSAALRDVHARRPESRMAAAERLGSAEPDELGAARAGLRTLSGDAHPHVRATAMASLGAVGEESDAAALVAALDDPSPEVREAAACAASRLASQERGRALVVEALGTALGSPHPEVRFQAALSIAELAPADAPPLLVPMLSDPDPEVRGQVVVALASLDEPHLHGQIARALEDASAEVQLEAALALGHKGDARGREVLLETLAERHRVDEVAGMLASLGVREAIPLLVRVAHSLFGNPLVRAAAGAALVRLGDPQGSAVLRRVLRAFSPLGRSYAVDLVRECDALDLVPELVRLTRRPRGVDPQALVDALRHFMARSPDAQQGLVALAGRGGDVGQLAQAALNGAPSHE